MNLFESLRYLPGRELMDTIYEHEGFRVERIASDDCPSGPYLQDEDEWVILIEGDAVLEVDGKEITLNTGDHTFIPKGTKHSVLQTSKNCLWLCVFLK